MGEVTGWLAVKTNTFDSEPLKQAGHNYSTYRVDGIENNLESGGRDGFDINIWKGQDGVQMLVSVVVLGDLAKFVDSGEIKVSLQARELSL